MKNWMTILPMRHEGLTYLVKRASKGVPQSVNGLTLQKNGLRQILKISLSKIGRNLRQMMIVQKLKSMKN
jgi:hypothetical protein